MRTRAPAFIEDRCAWNLRHVPQTLQIGDRVIPNPGRSAAIFVVHGIGKQGWTETAAALRAATEDALEAIEKWERANGLPEHAEAIRDGRIPPPFILDGHWANYDDVEATFPEDWQCFNDRERRFFTAVWKHRAVSDGRTYLWFLKQQLRLLHPAVRRKVGWRAWLLYIPLQVVSSFVLTAAFVRYRQVLTDFLNDVRLYLDPRGPIERAIAQRIDYRVGTTLLRLIGLDWNFRELADDQFLEAGGARVRFERVIWVSHSLGTVISYNVMSDLLQRAGELATHGDPRQQAGVQRFQRAIRRFVTMGSPLDKVAFLFGEHALRRWPDRVDPNRSRAERFAGSEDHSSKWWINFYHALDPISGALDSNWLFGDDPPFNFHIRSGWLPGAVHTKYWTDQMTLRFVLGRTYGKDVLPDRQFKPQDERTLARLGLVGYLVWATLLIGFAVGLLLWGPDLALWGFERSRASLGL